MRERRLSSANGHSSPERCEAIHTRGLGLKRGCTFYVNPGAPVLSLRLEGLREAQREGHGDHRENGGASSASPIVFYLLVFHGLIPAPTWVWLVVLALGGVLLALEDGIYGSGRDRSARGYDQIFGVRGQHGDKRRTRPTLKEPIPAPAGYAHVLEPLQGPARLYGPSRSPVKTANAAIAYVVAYTRRSGPGVDGRRAEGRIGLGYAERTCRVQTGRYVERHRHPGVCERRTSRSVCPRDPHHRAELRGRRPRIAFSESAGRVGLALLAARRPSR